MGEGISWKGLVLGVGDGRIATCVATHCLDFTARDLTNGQPTDVVVTTTTRTRPRVTRVTRQMAMTRC
jgi:hypothetical protein